MPVEQEHDQSLEEILYGDFYPKKSVTYEVEGLQIPFAPLSGEYIDYLGALPDGIFALSNYRFFANSKDVCIVNLPLGLIESLECPSTNVFMVSCKNGQYYKCTFDNENCAEVYRRLTEALRGCMTLPGCFALAFCAWSRTEGICSDEFKSEILPHQTSVFDREVERMGFCLDPQVKAWRICEVNTNYSVCSTYPKKHIVPFCITDEMVIDMAKYRSHQRFPTIVWRDKRTGLVMARSSQPLPGVFWWRNSSDEVFLSSIGESCRSNPGPELFLEQTIAQTPKDLLLIDARSYGSAFLNRAKGGGVECQEYYTNAVVVFMNLQNIHGIRKSFNQMKFYCGSGYDDTQWLTLLDQSKWLLHVLNLLKSALVIVDGIEVERKSVLVHCSDGWDRTPTILSLAQILLDPHYRTIKGFRDLIEREWLEFGHKFADRCGQGLHSNDTNERSPIFLLWLDCVHQIHHQFPCYFEFNMNLLVKLAHHTYSCLFGDFLYNSDLERLKNSDHKTVSVWGFLLNDAKLVNPLYQYFDKPLRPQCFARDMHFWSQVYVRRPSTVLTSNYAEELKCGIDNIEETGNDLNEGTNSEDVSEKDISPSSESPTEDDDLTKCTKSSALESDIKRRSLSLDRHSLADNFATPSSDMLQSLSLENFETNKLATQCQEIESIIKEYPSYNLNDNNADYMILHPDYTDLLSKEFLLSDAEESKYLAPRVSRTKQDEIHQPLVGRDESSRRIFRQLDVDGLTLDVDYYSVFMNRVLAVHQAKLEEFQKQVEDMKKKCESVKDAEARDDSSLSSGASDSTWEVVNKGSNKLVLWVPDHVVSQCSGCEKGFWMGLRRHHCRSCGKIFCFECTRRTMRCPDQLLNMPVRVCEACYAGADCS